MWMRSLMVAAAMTVCLGVAETALADTATVRLTNGGIVTGEVEIYVPGERIVVRLGSGESVTITQAEIATVEFTTPIPAAPPFAATPPGQQAAPTYDAQPAPQYGSPPPQQPYGAQPTPQYGSPPAQQPYYQAGVYGAQPAPAGQLRMPSLAPVFVLGGIGAGLAIVGAAVFSVSSPSYYDYDYSLTGGELAGIGLMGAGGALLIAAFAIALPIRLGRRARVRRHNAALAFAPTLDPVAGRYGLVAGLRF